MRYKHSIIQKYQIHRVIVNLPISVLGFYCPTTQNDKEYSVFGEIVDPRGVLGRLEMKLEGVLDFRLKQIKQWLNDNNSYTASASTHTEKSKPSPGREKS